MYRTMVGSVMLDLCWVCKICDQPTEFEKMRSNKFYLQNILSETTSQGNKKLSQQIQKDLPDLPQKATKKMGEQTNSAKHLKNDTILIALSFT